MVTGTVARPMGRQASTGVVEDHGKLEILGGGALAIYGGFLDACAACPISLEIWWTGVLIYR